MLLAPTLWSLHGGHRLLSGDRLLSVLLQPALGRVCQHAGRPIAENAALAVVTASFLQNLYLSYKVLCLLSSRCIIASASLGSKMEGVL